MFCDFSVAPSVCCFVDVVFSHTTSSIRLVLNSLRKPSLYVLAMFLFHATMAHSQDTKAVKKPLEVLVDMDHSHLNKKIEFTWKRDPFLKKPGYVAAGRQPVKLQLGAVLYGESGDSAAVINGETVFENSMVEGHLVKQIGPNFVIVTKDNSMRELQLSPIQKKVVKEVDIWDRLPAVNGRPLFDGKGEKDE